VREPMKTRLFKQRYATPQTPFFFLHVVTQLLIKYLV
jgi:hypothetical protein